MAKPRREITLGKEYGWVTVLCPAAKDKWGHILWKVRCRCGYEYSVSTSQLTKGTCKCKSCSREVSRPGRPIKRLSIGAIVNGFEVLAEVGQNKRGSILYECRCLKCGNTATYTRNDLISRKGHGCRRCSPNYHFRIDGDEACGLLPDGTAFTIDADLVEDFGKYNWFLNSKGYIQRGNRGLPKMMLHWFVMGQNAAHELSIDHVNRDRTDCRRSNLRYVTSAQNAMNHSKVSTNRSGYTGVFWNRRKQRWTSYICIDNRHLYLGYFKDKIIAAQCYNCACELLRGEYAGERNDVPDASEELKRKVFDKCMPYIDMKRAAKNQAVILLKEVS